MSLRVAHNTSALNTLRILERNTINLNRSLERLSSGFRINRAGDDPSGLIISEELRGQLAGIKAAQRAVGESINFFNVAESTLDEVNRLLITMRGLATVAINGATAPVQRTALNFEFQNATDSIERIFANANFAGLTIFNMLSGGSFASGRVFQLGEQAGDTATFAFKDATLGGTLTVNGTGITFNQFEALLAASSTLLTAGAASIALGRIETAITNISLYRGAMGAFTNNVFESQQRFLGIYLENLTASESFIRDTNIAAETTIFTRNQILVQASTAVLAQANVISQNVLQLLG